MTLPWIAHLVLSMCGVLGLGLLPGNHGEPDTEVDR